MVGLFRRRRADRERAVLDFLDTPEGQEDVSRVARVISAKPSELSPNEAELRTAIEKREEALEAAAQEIIPRACDADPAQVERSVGRQFSADVAAWVGYRIWETQLEDAQERRVIEIARELERDNPRHVYHDAKRWRLLRECEKRGLRPPPCTEQFNDPVSRHMEERGIPPDVIARRQHIVMLQIDDAARG